MWLPLAAGTLTIVVAVTAAAEAADRAETLDTGITAVKAARTDTPSEPDASGVSSPPGSADTLAAAVEQATRATAWPEKLTPAIEDVNADRAPQLTDPNCVNDWRTVRQHCVYGDPNGQHTAMLIGDSNAISWLPSLEVGLGASGWSIDSFGKWGCPAESVPVHSGEKDTYEECDEHRQWAIEQVALRNPDVVLLGSAEGYLSWLPSGNTGDEALSEWSAGLTATIDARPAHQPDRRSRLAALRQGAARVCRTRTSTPADCLSDIGGWWRPTVQAEQSAVDAARAAGLDVSFVDTNPWFCTAAGLCPGVVDGLVVRGDTNHISATYAREIAPALTESVLQAMSESPE